MNPKTSFLFLLFAYLSLCPMASGQAYQTGHLQRTFTDSSRSGRSIPCEIYYPAIAAGDNTSPAEGQFPVLAFGHGFVMPWSVYDVFWQNLVPQGFIMVFPTTEQGFSPSHLNFGKDLAFVLRELKRENSNPDFLLTGKVDSATAVMGHSMGGGSAFLALASDSSISAIATFAPANTNPSAITAASDIHKPALVFSGSNDCVTPPAVHQQPMYNSLSSACKSFISITGGNHCQFASFNLNCSFGQSTCSPQATISAAVQQGLVFTHLLPWLRYYLKKECAAGTEFQDNLASVQGTSSQQNCSLSCTSTHSEPAFAKDNFRAGPNPFTEKITLHATEGASMKGMMLCLTDLLGREIFRTSLPDHADFTMRTGFLTGGVYFLHLGNGSCIRLVKE